MGGARTPHILADKVNAISTRGGQIITNDPPPDLRPSYGPAYYVQMCTGPLKVFISTWGGVEPLFM